MGFGAKGSMAMTSFSGNESEVRHQVDELLTSFVEHVIKRKGRMLPFGRIAQNCELYCVVGTALNQ